MRSLLLLPLLALFACASEPDAPVPDASEPEVPAAAPATDAVRAMPIAPDTVDLQRWIEKALALEAVEDYEAQQTGARALTGELDAVTGWKSACGEDVGDAPGAGLYLHPLGDAGYLAEVTCSLAAYQSSFALVHVTPEEATLLRLPRYGDAGTLVDAEATNLAGLVMDGDPADRRFTVFAKSRGPGDCGVWTRYEVGEGAEAEAVEVRVRGCGEQVPDALPPPEEWPIVYAR